FYGQNCGSARSGASGWPRVYGGGFHHDDWRNGLGDRAAIHLVVPDGIGRGALVVDLGSASPLPDVFTAAGYGDTRRLLRKPVAELGRDGTGVHRGSWHAARTGNGVVLERTREVDGSR